jgi:uncharacterized protein YvpB
MKMEYIVTKPILSIYQKNALGLIETKPITILALEQAQVGKLFKIEQKYGQYVVEETTVTLVGYDENYYYIRKRLYCDNKLKDNEFIVINHSGEEQWN